MRSAILALLALLGAPAQALILDAAPNKVFTFAQATASFVGVAMLSATDSQTAVVENPGIAGGALAGVTLLPFSGDAKDQATGQLQISFLGGAGSAADTFSISLMGTASAVSALAAAGDPALAQVQLRGGLFFYLDPAYTGLPAGTPLGVLHAQALRAAEAYESFSMTLQDTVSGVTTVLSPGGSSFDLPLWIGHGYTIVADYTMTVPHGVDPAFSLTLAGSAVAAAVPEPNTLWLGLVGSAWLARRRRPC